MCFFNKCFSGRKYPTVLRIVGLLMPGRSFRDFGFFMLVINVESVLPMDALWRQKPMAEIWFFFAVALRPNAGHGLLILEFF